MEDEASQSSKPQPNQDTHSQVNASQSPQLHHDERPVTPPLPQQRPEPEEKKEPPSPALDPEVRARKVAELGAKLWLLFQQHAGKVVTEEMSFEELQQYLKQQDILNIAARFRHVIACIERGKPPHRDMKSYHYKNARILLAASIIHKFPKETLYDGKDVEDEQSKVCYQAATSVVKYVYHPEALVDDGVPDKKDLSRAYRVVKLFDSIFGNWKKRDIENVVETLGDRHAQLSKSLAVLNALDPSKREKLTDVIGTIQNSLEETKKKITTFAAADSKLVPGELLAKIEADTENQLEWQPSPYPSAHTTPLRGPQSPGSRGAPPAFQLPTSPFKLAPATVQSEEKTEPPSEAQTALEQERNSKMVNLDAIIKEEGHKLYWKEFGQQLANNDYHRVYQLLQEIRKRITKLNPNKKDEMEEQVDVDFIRQTIEHKAFDISTFHQLFGGIHVQIKALQAAADDQKWQEFHDKVLEDASAGKPVNELLPEVFNQVLIQLDRIEDAVAKFRAIQKMREDDPTK